MITRTLVAALALAALLLAAPANADDDCIEGLAMVLPDEAADEATREWLERERAAILAARCGEAPTDLTARPAAD